MHRNLRKYDHFSGAGTKLIRQPKNHCSVCQTAQVDAIQISFSHDLKVLSETPDKKNRLKQTVMSDSAAKNN